MKTKHLIPLTVLLVLILAVVACNTSASTASCGFVVGDATNKVILKRIVYPGQSVVLGDYETVTYVPCNSRNYIINDGKVTNANGDKVGDRDVLISATTAPGTPISIAASAFWTLNQSEEALKLFYTACLKYNCASSDDIGGESNFSTPGWNGLLAENFGPALDAAAKQAASEMDDRLWQSYDYALYQQLADRMSEIFADKVRARLGFNVDLFCGSGNSPWADPSKPGEGEFTCLPVRIVVDDVQRGEIDSTESTDGAVAINAQRLENAEAIYGDDAEFWLALQDTIDHCQAANTVCIINLGTNGPAVPTIIDVQEMPPTPENTPTETQEQP